MVIFIFVDVRKKNYDFEVGFIIKKEIECKDLGNLQFSQKSVIIYVWMENVQRNLKKLVEKENK